MIFNEIDIDVSERSLSYLSVEKVRQFLLDSQRRGFSFSITGVGGGGVPTVELSSRVQASRVGQFLMRKELLKFEIDPVKKEYFVCRIVARCGSMWPFRGGDSGKFENFNDVAWWIGEGEHVDIVSYGHRKHLLGQGYYEPGKNKGTWWPSDSDKYFELIKGVSGAVQQEQDYYNLATSDSLAGFRNYCFNDGVYRNYPYHDKGVYDVLLRVDEVSQIADANGGYRSLVFGSPVWVAEVTSPPPGMYGTGDESFPSAYWNGQEWDSTWLRKESSSRDANAIDSLIEDLRGTMPAMADIKVVGNFDSHNPAEESSERRTTFFDWIFRRKN